MINPISPTKTRDKSEELPENSTDISSPSTDEEPAAVQNDSEDTTGKPFKHYVVVHGHFYQPPRENPWTESVERQKSAHPYHDWNERIAFECYIPNSSARVSAPSGKTVDLVNNYAFMNFNFGPTLLSWMQTNLPTVYQWIISADAMSQTIHGGFGNAIAQAYNHMILPLASPQDLETQIIWGKEDFKHRFGREPESMWLPETAVDQTTVEALIAHGLQYIILAPGQALEVRPRGEEEWIDVSMGNIEPRRPYRLYLDNDSNDARTSDTWDTAPHIDVFFYDGGLAQNIAFGDLLTDSHRFTDRITCCFDPDPEWPQIVHVATDGESYGHHKPFADMTLAYTLKYALPERGVEVTNYSSYLDQHPPTWEVRLKPGPEGEGTSWSCAHGVGRWARDCGCSTGGEPGWHQRWRQPLRETLDWLRREIYKILETRGEKIFKDPWAARNEYVKVVLDRSPENVQCFLKRHLNEPLSTANQVEALRTMEMTRHGMLMYTSCAWFFCDISGIETVQNLQYAARAMEIVKQLTERDLEPDFVKMLENAPVNAKQYENGADLYEKQVRPAVVSRQRIISQYGIRALLSSEDPDKSIYHFTIQTVEAARPEAAGLRTYAGHVRVQSGITTEERDFLNLVVELPDNSFRSYVKPYKNNEEFSYLITRLENLKGDNLLTNGMVEAWRPLFGDHSYTLKDLFIEEKQRIYQSLLQERLEQLRGVYALLLTYYLPILQGFHDLGLPIPDHLKQETELALGRELYFELEKLSSTKDLGRLEMIRRRAVSVHELDISVNWSLAEKTMRKLVLGTLTEALQNPSDSTVSFLEKLVEFALEAGPKTYRYYTETRVFRLFMQLFAPENYRTASGIEPIGGEIPPEHRKNSKVRSLVETLADMFGFDTSVYR